MTTRAILYSACVLACGLFLFGDRAKAEILSCQDRLVKPGSSMYDVRFLCGPPDDMAQRVEIRTVPHEVRVPCARGWCTTIINSPMEVPIEEWTYDFGKQRLLQYLTFEGGTLIRVKAGGYGHKEMY
jgi:hypothetical protein